MERKRKVRPQIHDFSEIVIGAKFGRLTVIGFGKNKHNQTTVLCKCECGKNVEAKKYNIAHGQESCSCKQYEDNKIRAYKHGMGGTWKGGRKSRFYTIFFDIKARTNGKPLSEKNKCYEGVKNLWNSFEEFKDDMYESYLAHVKEYGEKDTTIDRIDPSGNYCKENCRWATIKEQGYNKRNTIKAVINGKEMNSGDVMEMLGVERHTAITYLRNNQI